MTDTPADRPQIALMQARPLPEAAEGDVPDWIHLLPAGAEVTTQDGRGPYRLEDPAALVAAAQGRRLPVDENHAIDLAAPRGEASPARGWIVELQARADGIWGRVDWTAAGRALMADRAYAGVSPVIVHDKARRIVGILRASLTNRPNLRGLTALHSQKEDGMSLTAIASALGLAEDATEAQALEAIARLRDAPERSAALQAEASAREVALQAEINTLAADLKALREGVAREKAEAFVDRAIAEMRPGVKVSRERWIALHMADPAATEAQILAIPALARAGELPARPKAEPAGEIALQAEHREAARLLGIDLKTYTEALEAERRHEESR